MQNTFHFRLLHFRTHLISPLAQTSILHLISYTSSHPTIMRLFMHPVSQSCMSNKKVSHLGVSDPLIFLLLFFLTFFSATAHLCCSSVSMFGNLASKLRSIIYLASIVSILYVTSTLLRSIYILLLHLDLPDPTSPLYYATRLYATFPCSILFYSCLL